MPSDLHRQNKMYRNRYVLCSLGITGCFLAVLLLLTVTGRSGRSSGHLSGKRAVFLSNPEDAYLRWHGAGQRGRIVIGISRWLNFVDIDTTRIITARNPKPLRVTNLAAGAEKQLSARNFMAVAVMNGIIREIIHVVPEAEYPDRVAAVSAVKGATVRANHISVPHLGTPRRITTLKGVEGYGEPVLLYLNASFFRYYTPEEVLAHLKGTALHIDEAVLCLSLDDAEVTEEERDRLRRFADLMGSSGI